MSALKNKILRDIGIILHKMDATGRADPALIPAIYRLSGPLEEIKSEWFKVRSPDGSHFYVAALNVGIFLDLVKCRFIRMQHAGDDPGFTRTALALLPAMDKILEITQAYEINKDTVREVLRSTVDLRRRAISKTD